MAKTQHGRDLTGAEMAQMIDEFVNCHEDAVEREAFTDQIVNRTHRTLQQSIMRLFLAPIEKWAELKEHWYDARNEATVLMAKKIVAATGDKYDRHLPLI